ncbi:MAG: efflux RND transporter periplasmic adaptor subunit [Lewinellaceae bacterium]|nr:efflux RND transporter periplasmic adaptor subunit [Lewinellaceae bacterium]
MKKLILPILALGLLTLTAFKLFNNKAVAEEKVYRHDPEQKILVAAEPVGLQSLSKSTQWLGTFQPNREMTVSSETMGRVTYMGVKEGDHIAAGSIVAKLDDETLHLQLKAAEVAWENAKNDVAHYTALVKGDAVPQMQLDKAILQLSSAESQVMLLRKQIRMSTIRAGISGIVTEKMFEPGTVVSPGAPLVQITDIATLKLTLDVPEAEISKVKIGQAIEVKSDVYPGAAFKGTVSLIGSKGDGAHNFPVEIQVANSSKNPLKAGMYGTVSLGENLSSESLAIPKEALVGSAKNAQVYVVQDGKAVLKDITLGASNEQYYEVLNGLSAGETVVVSGQINLRDGANVNVGE